VWNLFEYGGLKSSLKPSIANQSQYLYDKILKEIDGKYVLIGKFFCGHVAIQITALAFKKNLMKPTGLITIETVPDTNLNIYDPQEDEQYFITQILSKSNTFYTSMIGNNATFKYKNNNYSNILNNHIAYIEAAIIIFSKYLHPSKTTLSL
jgi:hypothetical protein